MVEALIAVPGYTNWTESVIFTFFLVCSVAWELLAHLLEKRFSHRPGIWAVVRHLKDELLLFGLLSLLLPFITMGLSHICIPLRKAGAEGGHTPAALLAPCATAVRRLLSAAGSDAYECGIGEWQPFSATVLHDTHVLLFMIAVAHVLYAMATMLLTLFRVRRWAHWEHSDRSLARLGGRVVTSLGSNSTSSAAWALLNQFTSSFSKPVYLGLRRLFLAQLQDAAALAPGTAGVTTLSCFPFHAFLVERVELQMAHIVELEWYMWCIAVVLLAFPTEWRPYAMYGHMALAAATLLVCGAKLHAIVVQLASRSHFLFGPQGQLGASGGGATPHQPPSPRQQPLRPSPLGLQPEAAASSSAGGHASTLALQPAEDTWEHQSPEQSPEQSPGLSPGQSLEWSQHRANSPVPSPHQAPTIRKASPFALSATAPATTAPVNVVLLQSTPAAPRATPTGASAITAILEKGSLHRGSLPLLAAAGGKEDTLSGDAPATSPRPASSLQRVSLPLLRAAAPAAGGKAHGGQGAKAAHSHAAKGRAHRGSLQRVSMPLLATAAAAAAAAEAAAAVAPADSPPVPVKARIVGKHHASPKRRACSQEARQEAAQQALRRRLRAHREWEELFWFKRPAIVLMLYKAAYFSVAFTVAELLSDAWLHGSYVGPSLAAAHQLTVALVLLVLVVLLTLHSAWFVLPVYALCVMASDEAVDAAVEFIQHQETLLTPSKEGPAEVTRILQRALSRAALQHQWSSAAAAAEEAAASAPGTPRILRILAVGSRQGSGAGGRWPGSRQGSGGGVRWPGSRQASGGGALWPGSRQGSGGGGLWQGSRKQSLGGDEQQGPGGSGLHEGSTGGQPPHTTSSNSGPLRPQRSEGGEGGEAGGAAAPTEKRSLAPSPSPPSLAPHPSPPMLEGDGDFVLGAWVPGAEEDQGVTEQAPAMSQQQAPEQGEDQVYEQQQ